MHFVYLLPLSKFLISTFFSRQGETDGERETKAEAQMKKEKDTEKCREREREDRVYHSERLE